LQNPIRVAKSSSTRGGLINRRIILPVLLACGLASAQTITTFSTPGAGTSAGQGTGGFGINPEGIVGSYVDSSNVFHGFVTAAPSKTFITLTDPDAGQVSGQGTFAGNINPGRGDRRILQ
jgi:hypothetical protein